MWFSKCRSTMSFVRAPLIVEKYPHPPEAHAPDTGASTGKTRAGFYGMPPLYEPHQITDHQLRRHRHKQGHMIARQHITDDADAIFLAQLTANAAYAQPNIACQTLVAIRLAKAGPT